MYRKILYKIKVVKQKIKKTFEKSGVPLYRWGLWLYISILVSSVMAFGFIVYITHMVDKGDAIYMLGMLPIMGNVVGLLLYFITKNLKNKMEKIMNGIERVGKGDMDVEIALENADEFATLYKYFNKMVKELKVTKQEMQNFMNDFSHEFKTPIVSIKGFAEMLLETEVNEEDRTLYLEIIKNEAGRLAELSQNTLLLSKLEAEQVVTNREIFDLDEQISQSVILLYHEIEKKGIHLEMDLPHIKYYGNQQLLKQIWINLVGNAVKFTPENGEIEITMVKHKSNIEVEVSDSGIGMDEKTKSRIFKKYYQSDTSRFKQGFGLGLSIVERIVDLCEGEITVESMPGIGSIFLVNLPMVKD